jgi:hypothetical protein
MSAYAGSQAPGPQHFSSFSVFKEIRVVLVLAAGVMPR